MPIYVETLIRASMDEVWRHTQDPLLHARWDLRFSEITYLPKKSEDEPQRFSYRTRLGFGLKIAGEGESRGERQTADGSRTSALRFWSEDPKSLIREGSGYWRYIPENGGVRFITLYDYETRFGVVGRAVDRLVFRPLMAWATAWSFDRLRIWIERGITPEAARDAAAVHATCRVLLALIWIYQGAIPKLLFPELGELQIIQSTGFFADGASTLVVWLGMAEIAFGFLHLIRWGSRWVLHANFVVLLTLLIPASFQTPHIFVTPFNATTLTLAMVGLASAALLAASHAPLSAWVRWSSWRPPR